MTDYLLDTRRWVDPGAKFPPEHWPVRIRNSLKNAGIDTWGQLARMSKAEIARIPGLGLLSQKQLAQIMDEMR